MSQTPDNGATMRDDQLLQWLTQDHRSTLDWTTLDADQIAAEQAAALYALAQLQTVEPIPAELERRLLDSVKLAAAAAGTPTPASSRRRPWWSNAGLAWGGASFASAIAVMLAVRLAMLPVVAVPASHVELASSDHYSLQPGPDAAGKLVKGEVMWNPTQGGGLIKVSGLPVNDPTLEQYQLWIFDGTRDERYPVDGGVFNVVRNGEAEVWIRVPIPVHKAAMFAVTVEKAGGAVVSDRSRIVALAKVGV